MTSRIVNRVPLLRKPQRVVVHEYPTTLETIYIGVDVRGRVRTTSRRTIPFRQEAQQ
ncbi:hypothetical protein SEA_PHABULOSO_104 [Gordonia phage Phabuloso]|nr:hypothetical protein SEA_PHABULOSO_104 [Gordonia phage Phabuloso]WKW86377.1 hypothetical protein SEA_BUDSKI_102 [Gordonia phage Budski]